MSKHNTFFLQRWPFIVFTLLAVLAPEAFGAVSVPGAPTIGKATAGNARASIAFTIPSSNGGSAITGYTASCVGGGSTKTGTGTSSPISVTSMTNGTAYSCKVTATNAKGTSAASSAVSVTPAATVPGAPTIGAATAGNASASIAFTIPSSNGGSAITGYTASCVGGGSTKTGTSTSSPIPVSSMTNSTAYSCTVTATNAKGTSAASSAVSVTPAATVPGAPTIGAATAGNASASIAFTIPSSNGGTAITGYTASCVGGGSTKTGTGTSSPIPVSDMTNSTAYSCTVTATNAKGTGSASGAVSVTPSSTAAAKPNAPTINSVTAMTSSVLIKFTAASTGGTASYFAASCKPSGGSAVVSGNFASSPIYLGGLTNGLSYSCTVTATNSTGTSSASTAVSGSPAAASLTLVAPSVNGVLPGDGRISVQFNFIGAKVTTLTTSVSETPATGYLAVCYSSDSGVSNTSMGSAEYSSGTSSNPMANVTNPLVVSGLTNGKTYNCAVGSWAVNSSGKYTLAVSGSSSAVVPNAGPSNALGVLSNIVNTTHITAYPTYSSYCGYTNQDATGAGAVPSVSYGASGASTGTSQAALTCNGTSTRTLTGNALPDHIASKFFTNGLSGYKNSPYFSGNPNYIGTASVSKTIPYAGTISSAYTVGSDGYDTSSCYTYKSTSSPSGTNSTFTNSSGTYRCKFVHYNYANNSVLIEPGTAETYAVTNGTTYKVVGKNLYQDVGLDPSNAHNQPTMSGGSTLFYGNYHYHGIPEGHVARIGKGNSTMTLVAFAADGFPIYARYGYSSRLSSTGGVKIMKSNYRLRTSAEITAAGYTDRPLVALAPYGAFEQDWVFDASSGGDLDACNGRYGVTPESPTEAVYHYFITDSYPFIQRCVFGKDPASWATSNQ